MGKKRGIREGMPRAPEDVKNQKGIKYTQRGVIWNDILAAYD